MSDNISRRIEQMVEKFCDDYCASVDCANCGVSAESVTEFLKAERTGHWIDRIEEHGDSIGIYPWEVFKCSECGHLTAGNEYNYCPNCGADMRGDKDERK